MISTMSEGAPPAPRGPEVFEKALQKAGVNMTASDWTAKANSLSSLVSTEMWRPRIRVGAPQKDHYLFLNYMKVHDAPEYNDFEGAVWRPMAEAWVKRDRKADGSSRPSCCLRGLRRPMLLTVPTFIQPGTRRSNSGRLKRRSRRYTAGRTISRPWTEGSSCATSHGVNCGW